MSSRHALPWWRYGVAVLALALAPVIGAVMVTAGFGGLFAAAIGVMNPGEAGILVAGLAALAIGLGTARLFLWALQGRKLLLRTQRMALGVLALAAGTAAVALAPSPLWTQRAVVAAGSAYGAFGLWLVLDALHDRWSV